MPYCIIRNNKKPHTLKIFSFVDWQKTPKTYAKINGCTLTNTGIIPDRKQVDLIGVRFRRADIEENIRTVYTHDNAGIVFYLRVTIPAVLCVFIYFIVITTDI